MQIMQFRGDKLTEIKKENQGKNSEKKNSLVQQTKSGREFVAPKTAWRLG